MVIWKPPEGIDSGLLKALPTNQLEGLSKTTKTLGIGIRDLPAAWRIICSANFR
jgi:hypothetical protein